MKKKKNKKGNSSRRVEVDVSGQIGDTKDTVFAFSNGSKYSIFVSGKVKRQLKKHFENKKLKLNFYFHFYIAGLTVLLGQKLDSFDDQVRDALLSRLKKFKSKQNLSVSFKSVGKKSPAHILAYNVFVEKKEPDKKVTLGDLLKIIDKK